MDDKQDQPDGDPVRTRRLSEAIREVKNAVADRSDILGDLREARQARIDLLVQELESVIDDIPPEDDRFDLAVSSGVEPRFWVDAVAHVHIGRDGRTYCFVRDLRRGREVIAESTDAREMAEYVTFYVAERMVERERLQMEGVSSGRRSSLPSREWLNPPEEAEAAEKIEKDQTPDTVEETDSDTITAARAKSEPATVRSGKRRRWWLTALLALIVILLGMVVGFFAIALFIAPELLQNLLSQVTDTSGVSAGTYREIASRF
ncbi:hypothetical protein [Notoacmeibacter ruber]|uniref:Uncharacterized protein n=1 Tax=Notoacmeibacter ruber TaxID=2670375 RepID=A0A3L7JCH2_9HYPH|nr:hypothetical protein [Notoacmeibacter ruber]RLQ88363.1 hypothetical protein D8780_09250 [Notoacmeibacter ruber]